MEITKAIINYLKYLQELSKRIGVKVDFSDISSKRRKILIENNQLFGLLYLLPEFYNIPLNEEITIDRLIDKDLYSYISSKTIEIKTYNKALFIGIGLLKYSFLFEKTKLNNIFAPLFVVNVEIEEKNKGYILTPNQVFFNYDLLSKLPIKNENENENYLPQQLEIIDMIKNVEEELENAKNTIQLQNIALNYIQQIKRIFNLQEIEILLNAQDIKDKFNFYLNRSYLFISNFPSEISTYKSLGLLITEIEKREEFSNKPLEKLFNVAFKLLLKSEKIDFSRPQLDNQFYLHLYQENENYIPIPLSSKQKEAIEKAINYELSYIQGPPGTGKTHLITAIILYSILSELNILIVSQKAPALRVLFEKLKNILNLTDNFLPFIYYYQDYRKKLKEVISNLIQESKYLLYDYNNQSKKYKLNKLKKDIENMIQELKENLNKYEDISTLNNEYYNISEQLENDLKYFEKEYYEIRNYLINFNNYNLQAFMKELEKYTKVFKILQKLGNIKLLILRKILFLRYIKKNYKLYFKNSLNLEFSLMINILHKIIKNYFELIQINYKLKAYDYNKTINRINFLKEEIQKKAKEYIRLYKEYKICNELELTESKIELENFNKVLYYNKPNKIKDAQNSTNYEKLLRIFNVWIVDIPSVDKILPMKPNLFDIVIVDEASQVNLAQVIPIFYRAKRICIIGDHKQLNLISSGIPLQISNRLDNYIWEKYKPANLSYEEAKERKLTFTSSSILDFIRENSFGFPETMLDEHFRSVEPLATFTNQEFYENKLTIMTKNPNYEFQVFKEIKLNAKRNEKIKVIVEEMEKTLEIIQNLKQFRRYEEIVLPDIIPSNFTIGVLSFLREQVESIKIRLYETLEVDESIVVGTPEELQGHEVDIMIISLALDETCRDSRNHYENKNRFNVATSRAKFITFLIHSGIPPNFELTKRYISHFTNFQNTPNIENPIFNPNNFESELEKVVYHSLINIIKDLENKYKTKIKIYNQYKTCGYRLDFVLHDEKSKRFLGIEVDGPHHFENKYTKQYSYEHIYRIEKLKRAGWNIINTPYYKWYINKFIDITHPTLKEELNRIKEKIEELMLRN
jgi:superfamily I DNA and/or RNA helicase/very-short-patch-repair endonuclease